MQQTHAHICCNLGALGIVKVLQGQLRPGRLIAGLVYQLGHAIAVRILPDAQLTWHISDALRRDASCCDTADGCTADVECAGICVLLFAG